jgi:hypothetical protein
MTALTMQAVSRQSGLSGPTLRYYEEIGLLGPIERDASSGHRRCGDRDDSGLELVAADLLVDDGWADAAAGCEEVHHVASPMV